MLVESRGWRATVLSCMFSLAEQEQATSQRDVDFNDSDVATAANDDTDSDAFDAEVFL